VGNIRRKIMDEAEKNLARKVIAFFNTQEGVNGSFTPNENHILDRWISLGVVNPNAFVDVTSGADAYRQFIQSLGYPFTALGEQEINKKEPIKTIVSQESFTMSNENIFIVHGHDEAVKEKIARFIERLGYKPIILHEQPNGGRTIIEKLEHYSTVGFAIVLLTPDDIGGTSDDEKNLKRRARQNVIFEFGYFAGKLGRNRVCAIYKEDVDLPSDIDGVIYIPLDLSDAWKVKVVKEMEQAGYPVDRGKL
jgi:predicted nucleotide-binding protein